MVSAVSAVLRRLSVQAGETERTRHCTPGRLEALRSQVATSMSRIEKKWIITQAE